MHVGEGDGEEQTLVTYKLFWLVHTISVTIHILNFPKYFLRVVETLKPDIENECEVTSDPSEVYLDLDPSLIIKI